MLQHNDHSDTELISLLNQGDTKAFEIIYRRYAPALFKYTRKNISRKEDCEEIIQEIFESLWLRHKQLSHVTTLSGYLFSMARYKIIRYFQHSKVIMKYAEHFRLFEAVYDNSTGQEGPSEDRSAMIDKSIASLPARCQEAVKLRLNENLSNTDIAKRMNISKGTVENYMVTALNHFKSSCQDLHA
jgi:RNA polymerase sigma-19 factor, ECF subfamily